VVSSIPEERRVNGASLIGGAAVLVVFLLILQDRSITIAASDNPPSISKPVSRADRGPPNTQRIYSDWNVPN
jgi:hypothetical protein